jgi:hypothetical protein
VGDAPSRRAPCASLAPSSFRVVLVGALVLLGGLVLDGVAAAAPVRSRQAPEPTAGDEPPALADAQRDLARAREDLAAWEQANGADPAVRVAELDAQLAGLEAQRLEPTTVEERAQLEFAVAALTAERADAVAAQQRHDVLVEAELDARAAVVAAKLAAPAPEWSPAATAPPAATGVTTEPPVRDDTWVVLALGAGLVLLAALGVAAIRHRRWRANVFALEGAEGRGRSRRRVALEERVDVPVERPRRLRARSREREQP